MAVAKKITVAVSHISPFVIESKGVYSGFEIELWEMIAKEMNVSCTYEKHAFQDLIPLIKDKKADLAFASVTINEAREELVDFSHPTFHSGLRMLVSRKRENIDVSSTVKAFFTQGYKQFIKPLIVLGLIIFFLGCILFLTEQHNGSLSPTFFPGAFQATWFFICSILGLDGGLFVYKISSWGGRLILSLGQLISLAFLGLFLGELTAFLTTKKIRLHIEKPEDLRGRPVATVKESTSEAALKNLGARVVPVKTITDAYKKLKKGSVDAVVFDAPQLVYYALNDGAAWADVVGEMFEKQDYGFVLQNDSPLRKQVNLALLTIQENGSYDELYEKWFGKG